jgi:aminoglycoside 6'-N-acetyltransferase I
MRIVDLKPEDKAIIRQVAEMLVESMAPMTDSWPTIEEALEEVQESLAADRISRAAIDDNGEVLGWIGGISEYDGNVWELHPLAVRCDRQRQGIGRALVADLEERVRERGGCTIRVGSDDEMGLTSLSGVDLYPNVLGHLANIRNLNGHPFEFYQKVGFVIVGVVPDANGFGKPDIIMAKRVC